MQHATMIFVPTDQAMMDIHDPDAQYQSIRRVVHEHIVMRRINPDLHNLGQNDLAYALKLSTGAINISHMSMHITIDMESIEDPKSRKHRIDALMVSEQPQGKVTLAEIQMDPYKLLAVNFDKAQRSCSSALLTFNNQKLYSGEGSMSENVQSFRMMIWAIQGLANQCWACSFLAAVPEHLAGADRYTREAMLVCPGLPLSERVALYSLLLQPTCGMARSMLQMSAPAGVTSMQTDGITSMMVLTNYVSERAVPM